MYEIPCEVVFHATELGVDFLDPSQTLTFPGIDNPQCVPVMLIDDLLAENEEVFDLELTSPSPGVLDTARTSALFTINNTGMSSCSVYGEHVLKSWSLHGLFTEDHVTVSLEAAKTVAEGDSVVVTLTLDLGLLTLADPVFVLVSTITDIGGSNPGM